MFEGSIEGTPLESLCIAAGMVMHVVVKHGVGDIDKLEALANDIEASKSANRDFVAEAVQMIAGGIYTAASD